MKIKRVCYFNESGWTEKLPAMDSPNTVVFIFGASEYFENKKPFEDLKKQYPSAIIFGCSSAGEIAGDKVQDKSLSVAITQFENTHVRMVCLPIDNSKDSKEIGKSLAKSLSAEDLTGVVILSEGLGINGSNLVEGFNNTSAAHVKVTGGLAGDGDQFKRTWVLKNGFPVTKHVSALGLYGKNVRMEHGSKGGWDIFGPERKITKSDGNKLLELDGKPALTLYKEYLAGKAKELPASGLLFPLQIRKDLNDEKRLVRTILAVDEKDHSLTFAGDMPVGWHAQLMKANFTRLIEGASEAASNLSSAGDSALNIAISCVGRRLVLGQRTEEELESVLQALPIGTEQVGFYSYGELSPFVKGSPCELHNQTMTITLISETV